MDATFIPGFAVISRKAAGSTETELKTVVYFAGTERRSTTEPSVGDRLPSFPTF